LIFGSCSVQAYGQVQLVEYSIGFLLEIGQTLHVTFQGLWFFLETDAALVADNGDKIPFTMKSFKSTRDAGMPPFPITSIACECVPGLCRDKSRVLWLSVTIFGPQKTSLFTKSNAAIFFLSVAASCVLFAKEPLYLPTSKLLFTTRHVILSGSFCEAGLKKFETAFSIPSETRFLRDARQITYE
jgi:hypothetical protein